MHTCSGSTQALNESHKRIYLARISGPQVLDKGRKRLSTDEQHQAVYKTSQSAINLENVSNSSNLQQRRQNTAIGSSRFDMQRSEVRLEFKNGMTMEALPQKKISLARHCRGLRTSKIPHECFSFEESTLKSFFGTAKSGSHAHIFNQPSVQRLQFAQDAPVGSMENCVSLDSQRASQQLGQKEQPDSEDQIINVDTPTHEEGKPPVINMEEPLVRRLGDRSNRMIDFLGDSLRKQVTLHT